LIIDDIRKNFSIETLFYAITTGIQVEKKNQAPFLNPDSKIVITSNFSIQGEGDSFKRRKEEYEISKYYSSEYSPVTEFGKNFFSDWNEFDWLLFDNLMVECIQTYFEYGLLQAPKINIEKRKIIESTNIHFFKFAEENILIGTSYNKDGLYDEFYNDFGSKDLSKNKFTLWLKKFAEYKKCELVMKSGTNNKVKYIFLKQKEPNKQKQEEIKDVPSVIDIELYKKMLKKATDASEKVVWLKNYKTDFTLEKQVLINKNIPEKEKVILLQMLNE